MDPHRVTAIAHTHHPIAAPVAGVNVNKLLRRAGRGPAARILDLGCGQAAWAMQALAHCPDGHADAVDTNPYALERAEAAATMRELADRLTLHERDARTYVPDGDYDLVLCVGSTPVFGGFAQTLDLAGRHANAHGILIVGERFWDAPPAADALTALDVKPTDLTDLAGLLDTAADAGWHPIYAHVSDPAEWDDYEWSRTGSLLEWALDNPGHPDAADLMHTARTRRSNWLRGYRGILGFATLVLRREPR
ncbi:SAM-dependent methyltransferase [Paractinoplanes lichenicola]|uniref:Class I SAM-dependent methyltransferase n=1 Tax=Paractinoplanes lichenicola TaxID=2802976 RepID=A0ABS1VZE1_9ACTN|nr:class I SAM-dependent methyltransferase [Actinoplanes lichenicola]MBL7259860.1 class I SAM-dependent methyltransferase [Actinoplanes lichenicola]